MTSASFSTCFPFDGLKSLPPSVNNLFSGFPFSHEDNLHEQIEESLLLGRRTKGNLAWCFHSFLQLLQVSKGAFCRISPILTGRERMAD